MIRSIVRKLVGSLVGKFVAPSRAASPIVPAPVPAEPVKLEPPIAAVAEVTVRTCSIEACGRAFTPASETDKICPACVERREAFQAKRAPEPEMRVCVGSCGKACGRKFRPRHPSHSMCVACHKAMLREEEAKRPVVPAVPKHEVAESDVQAILKGIVIEDYAYVFKGDLPPCHEIRIGGRQVVITKAVPELTVDGKTARTSITRVMPELPKRPAPPAPRFVPKPKAKAQEEETKKDKAKASKGDRKRARHAA